MYYTQTCRYIFKQARSSFCCVSRFNKYIDRTGSCYFTFEVEVIFVLTFDIAFGLARHSFLPTKGHLDAFLFICITLAMETIQNNDTFYRSY